MGKAAWNTHGGCRPYLKTRADSVGTLLGQEGPEVGLLLCCPCCGILHNCYNDCL